MQSLTFSSLSTRLFGGFLIVLALATASSAVTLFAVATLRGDNQERTASFLQLQSGLTVQDLVSESRLKVADFFIRGDRASQDEAQNALTALQEKLAGLIDEAQIQQVQAQSKTVVQAGLDRMQGSLNLIASVGGVANPIMTLAEASARAGGASAQSGLDVAFSFNRLSLAMARYAETETERFIADAGDEALRLQSALTSLEAAPESTPRIRRQVGVAREKLTELQHVFSVFKTACAQRVAARNALDKTLTAVASQIDEAKNQAQTRFERLDGRAADSLTRLSTLSWLAVAAVTILGLGLAWLIGRSLSRPIHALQMAMGRIAGGELDQPAPGADRRDEIGAMAQAVERFRQGLAHARTLEQEAASRRQEAAERRRADLADLAGQLETTIGETVRAMRGAVGDLGATATELSTLSTGAAREIEELNASASGSAANVESLAAAAEQLASSISEVGRSAAAGSVTARDVSQEADAAENHMRALADAADRIGGVVDVISVIARHTNLLALNAMIESARAGEAGAGFAVVANEVKTLASQTASATEDIQRQIADMQQLSRDAATAIHSVIDRIRHVDQAVAGIAAAVDQQQATTGQIARNAQDAADGSDHVRRSITMIADGVTQTDAAAAAVKTASEQLRGRSNALGDELAEVVRRLRAS